MKIHNHDLIVKKLTGLLHNHPAPLLATQNEVSIPVVERIAKKITNQLFSPTIFVHDGKICDGHHRYLACLLVGHKADVVAWALAPSHIVYQWNTLIFSEEDSDRDGAAEKYLLETASLNDKTVGEIKDILDKSVLL